MTQKLKKILLLCLLTGTLFVSCTMEEEQKTNHFDNKINVTQKKYSELIQNSSFKKTMSKIPRHIKVRSNFNGRTVMEEQYGFTIIDAPVKTTNTDNLIVHNILVKSDTLFQGNYFENLVININKNNNEIKAYIIKYDLLDNITVSNHNSFNLNATRTVREIIYNDAQSNTGKEEIPCYDIQVLMCSNDGTGNYTSEAHPVGPGCYNNTSFHFWQTVDGGCGSGGTTDAVTFDPIDTSGGVGGTTGPTSGNNSTGNTTTEYTSTLLENPTPLCTTCPEFSEDPCVKLKNLFNSPKPDIKSTIINYMRPNIAVNPSGEIGAGLIKTDSRALNTRLLQPTTSNEIFIPTGGSYYSGIHTHPLDTYPMFSWSDVYTLYKMNKNLSPNNYGNASFLLVCQDDSGVFQTYAIVFDETISNTIDNIFNDPENSNCSPEAIAEMMDERLEKKYAKEYEQGSRNYERAFLRMMMGYNVTLYKANSDLNNWNKLSLNNLSGTNVNTTPCN